MRKRLVAVVAVLGIVVAACGGDDTGDASPTDDSGNGADAPSTDGGDVDADGVLRIGYDLIAGARGGVSFDPRASRVTVPDIGMYHWVYGGLMRPTEEGLVPGLAEEATVVDDTTIEVVLRPGLTFSDGTPLDAEVVKATFDRNLEDPDLPAFRSGYFSLESVEVTGENTLELNIPDGTAASWRDLYLGGHGAVVLPPDFDPQAPVGAGPFTISDYVPEERVVFEKNPDYWDADAIQVGRIEMVNVPDSQAAVSALGAGQVDWAPLDYGSIDALGNDLDLHLDVSKVSFVQIQMCKSQEPFDDPRVRQALSYAIDREAINEAIFDGEGEPAWDLWPADHRLHNDELTERHAYDPDHARELLAEAGFEDGIEFGLIPIPSANIPQVAQIVQQQWAAVGITMELVQTSNFAEDLYVTNRAPTGMVPNTSDDMGKLDQLSGSSINNMCRFQNEELDALVAELLTVPAESDEAVELWAELQELVIGEAMMLPVVFRPEAFGYDGDRVSNGAPGDYAIPVPDIWELQVTS